MGIYRTIHTSFWSDTKVVDDYTPEDKLFMLYCLTNEHTNLCGCYEVSIKQIANDLGYDKDTVDKLIRRFSEVHKTISYDYDTKELLIKNWNKFNWNASPKLDQPLLKEIKNIKSYEFMKELADIYNKRDTVSIPYAYPMHTSITNTNTNTNTITNIYNINNNIDNNIEEKELDNKREIAKEIINYLNEKTSKHFKYIDTNINKIKTRLKEGFTKEDCKKVIDIKCNAWLNDSKMNKYLRPETLFGNKFEGYLNENVEQTPEWMDKEIEKEQLSEEEIKELNEMLKEYK